MSLTTVLPHCYCRPDDAMTFAAIAAAFADARAKGVGLQAAARAYTKDNNIILKASPPLLLLRDPLTGENRWVNGSINLGASVAEAQSSFAAFKAASLRRNLSLEPIFISSTKIWRLVFANIVVLQADDIVQSINVTRSLSSDIKDSTWVRSAFATIKLPPAASQHEAFATVDAANSALSIVKAFRASALEDARARGFELGPVPADELVRVVSSK
jgi:hypothetical protein